MRYLFKLYKEKLVTSADLKTLINLQVCNEANPPKLVPVAGLCLPREYDPTQNPDLRQLFPNNPELFISPIYIDGDASLWGKFFCDLGAVRAPKIAMKDTIIVEELRNSGLDYLEEFFNYLKKKRSPRIIPENKGNNKRPTNNDTFDNFTFFPRLEKLKESPPFANLFWQSLNKEGKKLIEFDKGCAFIDGNKQDRPLHPRRFAYIKYVLNKHPIILGTDAQFHKASELYSPAFRVPGVNQLLCADINVPLGEELTAYIGFKTTISPSECFNQLTTLRSNNPTNITLYTSIVGQLVDGWDRLEEKQQANLLKKSWEFLASNNHWNNVQNLDLFAVPGTEPSPLSNRWFKVISLPPDRMKKLAAIFSRSVVTELVKEDEIVGATHDEKMKESLTVSLPFVARVIAHSNFEPIEAVLERLVQKLRQLQLLKVEKFPPVEGAIVSSLIYKNKLYFRPTAPIPEIYDMIARFLDPNPTPSLVKAMQLTTQESQTEWMAAYQMPQKELDNLRLQLAQLIDQPAAPAASQTNLASLPRTPQKESDSPPPERPVRKSLSDPSPADMPDTGDRIEEIALKSAEKPLLKRRGSSQKTDPRDISEEEKEEVGYWGEKWAVPRIVKRYQRLYNSADVQPVNGVYQIPFTARTEQGDYNADEWKSHKRLIEKGAQKVTVLWVNHQKESYLPYDLEITKIDKRNLKPRHADIKTTQTDQIRFFLSESEWQLAHQEEKYKIYLVRNAGKSQPQLGKLSNLPKLLPKMQVKCEIRGQEIKKV